MADINQAKQALEQAKEIAGRSTSNISQFKDSYDAEKMKIVKDETLSPVGQDKKIEELNTKFSKRLFDQLEKENNEYKQNIVKAENEAKRVIAEPLKEPHHTDLTIHNQELQDLKMASIFTNPREAISKVEKYADSINDPYYAQSIINELPGIYDRLSQRGLSAEEQRGLHSLYRKLDDKRMTDDKRQAKQMLKDTEGAFSKKLYGQLHSDPIQARLGLKPANYLNQPDSYKRMHLNK